MPKTPSQLAAQQRYRASLKGRIAQQVAQQRYRQSDKGKEAIARACEVRRARRAVQQLERQSQLIQEHPSA